MYLQAARVSPSDGGRSMRTYKLILLFLLGVALVGGCSKKKEEAAQLEQELTGQVDTAVQAPAETVAGPDTMAPTADAAAMPEEAPAYHAPAGSGYTVQVAGCEDRTYAEYLAQKYTNRGYEPYITATNVGGQTYYRVRIGSYQSLSEAKALKAELADRYSIKAWIDYVQ